MHRAGPGAAAIANHLGASPHALETVIPDKLYGRSPLAQSEWIKWAWAIRQLVSLAFPDGGGTACAVQAYLSNCLYWGLGIQHYLPSSEMMN